MLGNFYVVCRLLTLFQNLFFRNTVRVSGVWIQIRPKVPSESDLGPNCLQRLSDATNMQIFNEPVPENWVLIT